MPTPYWLTAGLLCLIWFQIVRSGLATGLVRAFPVLYWLIGACFVSLVAKVTVAFLIGHDAPIYIHVYYLTSLPVEAAIFAVMWSVGKSTGQQANLAPVAAAAVFTVWVGWQIWLEPLSSASWSSAYYQVWTGVKASQFALGYTVFLRIQAGQGAGRFIGSVQLATSMVLIFISGLLTLDHFFYTLTDGWPYGLFAHLQEPIWLIGWALIMWAARNPREARNFAPAATAPAGINRILLAGIWEMFKCLFLRSPRP